MYSVNVPGLKVIMEGKPALTTEDSALEQMMQVCKHIFSFKQLGSYDTLPYKRIIKVFDILVCICNDRYIGN